MHRLTQTLRKQKSSLSHFLFFISNHLSHPPSQAIFVLLILAIILGRCSNSVVHSWITVASRPV